MTTSNQWREAAAVLREHAAKFDLLADERDPWVVPPMHRPTCPLDSQPCTSWTCLVDVCAEPHRCERGHVWPVEFDFCRECAAENQGDGGRSAVSDSAVGGDSVRSEDDG